MRLEDAPRDERGRPIADPVYGALIQAIRDEAPDVFAHLDAARILVIAAAARRESSASVRPLKYGAEDTGGSASPNRGPMTGRYVKPRISIGGVEVLYEIALRPKFFLARTAAQRFEVWVHELWHVSPRFDGTLAEDRRHETSPAIEREVAEVVSRLSTKRGEAAAIAGSLFSFSGELRLNAWLSRPPSRELKGSRARLHYSERDIYSALVEQRSL